MNPADVDDIAFDKSHMIYPISLQFHHTISFSTRNNSMIHCNQRTNTPLDCNKMQMSVHDHTMKSYLSVGAMLCVFVRPGQRVSELWHLFEILVMASFWDSHYGLLIMASFVFCFNLYCMVCLFLSSGTTRPCGGPQQADPGLRR